MSIAQPIPSHSIPVLRRPPTKADRDVPTPTALERVGGALGRALAPLATLATKLRDARAFHPDGVVYDARTEVLECASLPGLGERLEGHVLLRFSGALLKDSSIEPPDALGLALRFRAGREIHLDVRPGEQDILFATLRSLVTAPFAGLVTDQHDFLRNTYFAAAPLEAQEVGRVMLRVVPMAAPRTTEGSRDEKLERAVESGRVRLRIDARKTYMTTYYPIAILHVEHRVALDQKQLFFSPFNAGRGLVPRGFVNAVRRAVYPASHRARLPAP